MPHKGNVACKHLFSRSHLQGLLSDADSRARSVVSLNSTSLPVESRQLVAVGVGVADEPLAVGTSLLSLGVFEDETHLVGAILEADLNVLVVAETRHQHANGEVGDETHADVKALGNRRSWLLLVTLMRIFFLVAIKVVLTDVKSSCEMSTLAPILNLGVTRVGDVEAEGCAGSIASGVNTGSVDGSTSVAGADVLSDQRLIVGRGPDDETELGRNGVCGGGNCGSRADEGDGSGSGEELHDDG